MIWEIKRILIAKQNQLLCYFFAALVCYQVLIATRDIRYCFIIKRLLLTLLTEQTTIWM